MADNIKPTAIQRINRLFGTDTSMPVDYTRRQVNKYNISNPNVLFTTNDRGEYDSKALELRQNKYLKHMWKRAEYDITNRQYQNTSNIVLMYRDCDLMDATPEIGTALDIVAEEATYVPKKGFMVNVDSKSERIKSILQDLLVNRLQINMILPMITRSTLKYGNTFMLLDIDVNNGIKGWKQLPVYEMERYEGMTNDNPYHTYYRNPSETDLDKDTSTKFVWVGQTEFTPYWNWQIAHFRLLYDSIFLPYGTSFLNKARRHWRLLSMMEDAMLLYRLERSWEKRVFKVNVGAIDEDDVEAYVNDVANEFKRTPLVDPLTGQLDLRKNVMTQSEDFFIAVRSPEEPSPIETLQAGQNLTAIDDIKYIYNKILTALRIPKPFLNVEETAGEGKNLSLMDVRFMRTVNKVQQCMLVELNKVCIIHLALLGFTDDLTNFTLSMNNPSSQAEMLELDNIAKKITTAKDAVSQNDNGIPLMSMTRAWKEILGWSEKEMADNLEELRLEAALGAELKMTNQIIKRTGIFDKIDNIYGEPGAEYGAPQEGDEDGMGGGGFGGGGGAGFGGDMDFGADMGGEDVEGAEGDMDLGDMTGGEAGGGDMGGESVGGTEEGAEPQPLSESFIRKMMSNIVEEEKKTKSSMKDKTNMYRKLLKERIERQKMFEDSTPKQVPLYDKAFLINEEIDNTSKNLETWLRNIETKD